MALQPWGSFSPREESYGSKSMRLFLIREKPYGPRVVGSCIVLASRWSFMFLESYERGYIKEV